MRVSTRNHQLSDHPFTSEFFWRSQQEFEEGYRVPLVNRVPLKNISGYAKECLERKEKNGFKLQEGVWLFWFLLF